MKTQWLVTAALLAAYGSAFGADWQLPSVQDVLKETRTGTQSVPSVTRGIGAVVAPQGEAAAPGRIPPPAGIKTMVTPEEMRKLVELAAYGYRHTKGRVWTKTVAVIYGYDLWSTTREDENGELTVQEVSTNVWGYVFSFDVASRRIHSQGKPLSSPEVQKYLKKELDFWLGKVYPEMSRK